MTKPWHVYAVGVFALLWNAFGALDYTLIQLGVEAYAANMPAMQRALIDGYPAWVTAVWAIAVWSPVLAAFLLLGGRKAAAAFFALSLACLLISGFYNYVISEPPLHAAAGYWVVGLWIVIAVVAVLLWLYARAMAKKGVLA